MAKSGRIRRYKVWNLVAGAVTLILLVVIIWIDVASGFWQETVILSGVAAGLVTFFFTALFLDDAVARRDHQKWYPVTRLALTDLLHTIADDERSDIKRGQIIARSLPTDTALTSEGLEALLRDVVTERDEITETLARWAQFLASSADVQDLMTHIADLAESLDDIRDEVIDLEERALIYNRAEPESVQTRLTKDAAQLHAEVESYNAATKNAINEILGIQKSLSDDS